MEIPVLDKVFAIEGGYVLDFSNRIFAEFFRAELRVKMAIPVGRFRAETKRKRPRYCRHMTPHARSPLLDVKAALAVGFLQSIHNK